MKMLVLGDDLMPRRPPPLIRGLFEHPLIQEKEKQRAGKKAWTAAFKRLRHTAAIDPEMKFPTKVLGLFPRIIIPDTNTFGALSRPKPCRLRSPLRVRGTGVRSHGVPHSMAAKLWGA